MELHRKRRGVLGVRPWSGFTLPVFLLLVMAATFLLTACGSTGALAESLIQQGDPLGAKVGDEAIDFTLPTANGKEVSLHQFDGRPVVLYFWASWCGTCTFDLPDLAAFAAREVVNELVVITVNIGEKPEFVQRYVEDTVGTEYEFVVASDASLSTFRQYRILSFPTTFFVDRDGVIRSMRVGRVNDDILSERVESIQ